MDIVVSTHKRCEMVDITSKVKDTVSRIGLSDGVVTVFCPHTTAAITINESADPDVKTDLLDHLARLVPERSQFKHAEGNSDAHIKASLVGPSVQVIVEGGKLRLGRWKAVYFCEFDGPRERKVWIN